MKPFLVLYATREGQTRRIAEHVGTTLRSRGFTVEVLNAAALPAEFAIANYAAAVLAASVHVGRHEPEMMAFVKSHRSELEQMRTLFLSVSASEAGAEDRTVSEAARERSTANVNKMIADFIAETGWTPARVFPVAGALKFLEYNLFLRIMIRLIARSSGSSIDTSRNTEYTDWEALDKFLVDWSAGFTEGAAVRPVPSDRYSRSPG